MSKTLTPVGLSKVAQNLVDSVDHATYMLDGAPREIPPFRHYVEDSTAKIYIYFDDSIAGKIEEVQLVDKDGDVIAETDKVFTKPQNKGLYVAFKYDLQEVEVESIETL